MYFFNSKIQWAQVAEQVEAEALRGGQKGQFALGPQQKGGPNSSEKKVNFHE